LFNLKDINNEKYNIMNSETIKLIAIASWGCGFSLKYQGEKIKFFTAQGCTLFVASLCGKKITMRLDDKKYQDWMLYCNVHEREFKNRTFLDIREEYEKKLLDEKETLEDMGCDY